MTTNMSFSRVGRRLSRLGLQVRGFESFLPVDGLPETERRVNAGDGSAAMALRALQEFTAFTNQLQKTARRVAFFTDVVVGAVVAFIARFVRADQYLFVVGALVFIQLALSIVSYFYIRSMFGKSNRPPGAPGEDFDEMRGVVLSGVLSSLWRNYPIRIVEFFTFVCAFLVLYSYDVTALGSLGPVEQFSHRVFDLVAVVFYGEQQTPYQKAMAALVNYVIVTPISWLLELWFPIRFDAEGLDGLAGRSAWIWGGTAVLVVGGYLLMGSPITFPSQFAQTSPSDFTAFEQDGFRIPIPGDLDQQTREGDETVYRGATTGRMLRVATGTAAGAPADWLQSHYDTDAGNAKAQHVAQPSATDGPYLRPAASTYSWGAQGDFYVVSWDDSNGIDHYKAVVATPQNGGTSWSMFELDSPLAQKIGCRRALGYMLDTMLASASLKEAVRDPGCN